MPRDDLTIDWNPRSLTPRTAFDPNMPPVDDQDAAAVLDEFTNRAANLPNEIAFMQDEIREKDKQMNECLEIIARHDTQIQKFIRLNGSHTKNPKEEALSKIIIENYDKAQILQEEKIALAHKTQIVMDKHTRWLDMQMKELLVRKHITLNRDEVLPSLLQTPAQERPRPNVVPTPLTQINNSAIPHARHPNQHPQRMMSGHQQSHSLGALSSASAPATPAASMLINQQRARESSLGAGVNKRQRLTGGIGTLPPSGLARQSSMTPGTPRAGTPIGRAGSAGPRTAQKGPMKAPPKGSRQGGAARRSKKSGLSRVKRSGNKNSPSSTNDSELSDAGSGDEEEDDEGMTPRKDGEGDATMLDVDDDEREDDKKYCVCQSVSYGDMVACDNEKCPYEWFHWRCVGLKSEPKGTWICPVCTEAKKRELK